MGFVVPFMKRKGGVGASTLARTYAVEAARAGASVVIADLDEMQLTCKRWAEHRKANGLKPEIRAEASTPRKAYDLADTADLLVIDTPPGWDDKQTLFVARWSTFCVRAVVAAIAWMTFTNACGCSTRFGAAGSRHFAMGWR